LHEKGREDEAEAQKKKETKKRKFARYFTGVAAVAMAALHSSLRSTTSACLRPCFSRIVARGHDRDSSEKGAHR